MNPFEVAILAGGLGTRLKARTGSVPKPMVPVLGAPLLEHQIALCRRHGFLRILLLVHHAHEVVRAYFGDGSRHGVTLGYAVEDQPRGTAGALEDARPRLSDPFLLLYGDTYLDVDLRRLWDTHARRGADATVFVHPNDHPWDSDLVELDADGCVSALHPSPHDADRDLDNLVNAALYVLQQTGLDGTIPRDAPSDLARHTLPAMVRAGRRLYGYRSPEYIKDVGTPERLDQVEGDVRAGVPERLSGRTLRPAVFLDRDGTLNREVHHLHAPAQVEILEGAADAVRRLNRAGHLAIVITNQPAVARGEVTADGLARIHARLAHLLGRAGAYLDALHACPHHPDGGFAGEVPELKVRCDCRKPGTASLDAACRDLLVDRRRSWLVGDSTADVETGRRAGVRSILVRTGYAGQDGKFPCRPDYITADLADAVAWILGGHAVMCRRMAAVAAAALDTRVVLIGGLARSGKSFAAQVLKETADAHGRTAHVLPLDSWLKPRGTRAEGRGVENRFDVAGLLATLRPLVAASERRSLDLPIYDRARRGMHDLPVPLSIGPEDLIIVEGVPALVIPELVALAGVRVHLEMPEPHRLAHLRADYRWRGEPDDAVEALLASRAIDETPPVTNARAHATFVVEAWTGA